MKLAIAALGTALVLATGAQAELDSYEQQEVINGNFGRTVTLAQNYETKRTGISNTGQDKFTTVFSSKNQTDTLDPLTAWERR